jgi:hypothetical protein
MVTVPSGSRLILTASDGRSLELLSLSDTPVADRSVLPVLALPGAFLVEMGSAELPTEEGLVQVQARLDRNEGLLELSVPRPPRPAQRRAHARGDMTLEIRGTATAGRKPEGTGVTDALMPRVAFHGRTEDISTGGLRARLAMDTAGSQVPQHLREMYVELELGGARPAGTVLRVVSLRSDLLQAQFVFISPSDREYLAQRLLGPL